MKLRSQWRGPRLPDWLYLSLLGVAMPVLVLLVVPLDHLRRRRRLTSTQRIVSESVRDASGPTGSASGGFGQGWRS
jgi:hypothetical protein